MYKAFIVASGLLLGLATSTVAQIQSDALPAPSDVGRKVERVGSVPPEKRAGDMASRLQGQLSLNSEETKQVYAVALSFTKGIEEDGLRYERDMEAYKNHEQNLAKRKADYEAGLKAVLTPKQYERHQMIEERFRKLREQGSIK